MKNFLLIFCFMILNACSLFENENGTDSIDYTSIDGATFYGTEFAFVYGNTFNVGTMTWSRLEEIDSDTYIYTATVSYTYEGETYTYTYYMKVKEYSYGVALYSQYIALDDSAKESAKNSTGYQLYTYQMTSSPYGYNISDEDTKNESNGYSPLSNI